MKLIDDNGKEIKIEDIKKVLINDKEIIIVKINNPDLYVSGEDYNFILSMIKNWADVHKIEPTIILGDTVDIYKGEKII